MFKSSLKSLRCSAAVLALCVAGSASAYEQLKAIVVDGKPLKTAPANIQAIGPLVDGLVEYELAVAASGGKSPADAKARLAKLDSLAGPAKSELSMFAKRLQAAGETAAFNRYALQQYEKQSPQLLAELKAVNGDAAGELAKAPSVIDSELASIKKEVAFLSPNLLLALLGIEDASAALYRSGSRACYFAMWLTPGMTTEGAYKYCQ